MIASDRTPTPRRRGRIGIRRPLLGFLAALALLAGSSLSTAYADGVGANLSCDDGTNLNLSLDLISLKDLTDSVQAMLDYPAGLTCSVTQLPSLNSSIAYRIAHSFIRNAFADSGNPQKDYAVGGGQATIVHRCAPDETNFGLSAHVDADMLQTGIGGTVNFTIPDCTSTVLVGQSYRGSHLGMKVDCLQVTGIKADLTAVVTQKTGLFADSAGEFTVPLNEIAVEAIDSPTGDMIGWEFQETGGTPIKPCEFLATADSTVDHGNVNVHDAS